MNEAWLTNNIACMRMRKLGSGQSIVFYINKEIEAKIRNMPHIGENDHIRVIDIVAWSIGETWSEERRAVYAWTTQGARYDRHQNIWKESKQSEAGLDQELAKSFLEDEALPLEQRYKASLQLEQGKNIDFGEGHFAQRIAERYAQFEQDDEHATNLAEEQEREVAPEIHFERQVQTPGAPTPSKHRVHDAVKSFVRNGMIAKGGAGFLWAFSSLLRITRDPLHLCAIKGFPHDIRVTLDFAKVVQDDRAEDKDQYQRCVKYILIGRHSEQDPLNIVIISPFEANDLWGDINSSNYVTLHTYSPRQSLGSASLDDLKLCTIPCSKPSPAIPDSARISLNLFAGQLFFRSYAEYIEVCRYLGLAWFPNEEGMIIQPDGFVPRSSQALIPSKYLRNGEPWQKSFSVSPVPFLKMLMDRIRYKCSGIEKTHMGRLLGGVILTEEDFPQSRKRSADEMEASPGSEENATGEEDSLMFD